MNAYDYGSIFDVPYLSGCCMVARSSSFIDCGGFDERYFLYLEDADLTRMLSETGRCIHFLILLLCIHGVVVTIASYLLLL